MRYILLTVGYCAYYTKIEICLSTKSSILAHLPQLYPCELDTAGASGPFFKIQLMEVGFFLHSLLMKFTVFFVTIHNTAIYFEQYQRIEIMFSPW